MRYLYKILGFAFFLVVLGFTLKNTQPVTINYYLGIQWNAPLILILFITFCTGAFFGILASLSLVVKHRRKRLNLEKELKKLQSEPE